ncbi:MAG: hypothetical protein JW775_00765 [Candidatus Aminicenantes bacterium]|nr:hypothetical protein [Candidatus Aminicenantes bacterium]
MTPCQAVLAAVLAVALAAARPLPAGQDRVSLHFAPAQGSLLHYSLSSVINVDGKNLLGNNLALNADSRGEIRLFAKATARDTVGTELTSPGLDVNIRLPDKVMSQKLGTTGEEPLEVVFNRTGKVESIRNPEAVGGNNPFNISLPQILRDYFPVFPAEPVGRGESWSETRRLTIPFQGLDLQVNLAITYTLDDILPAADGRLAYVSAVYKVTVSGSKDLGGSRGIFEGVGAGAGSLQIQVDKGWFSEYRIDFTTDASFVMVQGEDRLAEFPFSFSAFAEVVLINAQAPDPVIR